MRIDLLEKNICDVINEWQIKIGFREENMKLYYPDTTLIELLEIAKNASMEELYKAITQFKALVESRLGEIQVTNVKNRFCIDIPWEGCQYIAKHMPASQFLKDFLAVITDKNCSIEKIRRCFASFSEEFVQLDKSQIGLGHVFYFEKDDIDNYVYCIESDVFGFTYHRFTKADYYAMANTEE